MGNGDHGRNPGRRGVGRAQPRAAVQWNLVHQVSAVVPVASFSLALSGVPSLSLCQGIDLARKLQNCFVAGSVFDPVSIMALQNVSVQCWESRSCRNGRGGKPLLNHSRYETRRHANSKSRKKGGGNGSLWGMQEGCEKGG